MIGPQARARLRLRRNIGWKPMPRPICSRPSLAVHRAFQRFLRDRPRVALAAYWSLAFVVTHVPPFLPEDEGDDDEPLIGFDKIVHFGGYAGLAFLLMNALVPTNYAAAEAAGSERMTTRAVAITILICAIYGAVDELTQPPFGRTADPMDYVADLLGLGAGLLLFRLYRPR